MTRNTLFWLNTQKECPLKRLERSYDPGHTVLDSTSNSWQFFFCFFFFRALRVAFLLLLLPFRVCFSNPLAHSACNNIFQGLALLLLRSFLCCFPRLAARRVVQWAPRAVPSRLPTARPITLIPLLLLLPPTLFNYTFLIHSTPLESLNINKNVGQIFFFAKLVDSWSRYVVAFAIVDLVS